MRGTLALQMCFAHAVGVIIVTLIGTLMSADPGLDDAMVLAFIGLVASLVLFIPALVIALWLARQIYENLIAFVLLGPVVVGSLALMLGGAWFGGVAAGEAAISSGVFFLLARNDNPASYLAED